MSEENLEDYRLDKSMDHLHQRLFDNNCPTMHELFNFPGKFQEDVLTKMLIVMDQWLKWILVI